MLYFNTEYASLELENMLTSSIDDNAVFKDIKQELKNFCLEPTLCENIFGKFITEIDQYFNSFPLTGRSKELDQLMNEMNIPNFANYFNFQRNMSMNTEMAWDWIDQLIHCLKVHIKKIKIYDQFLNKYSLCKDGFEYLHSILKSIFTDCRNISFEDLKTYLNDCLLIMLNITDLAEDICHNYQNIIPISRRITDTAPMLARILISCCFDKVELEQNETVTVISKDFDTSLWTVEKTFCIEEEIRKVTLKIPSLFLIFDGFDREVVDKCALLRNRVISTWELLQREFKLLIFNSLVDEVNEGELLNICDCERFMCLSILDRSIRSLELDKSQCEEVLQLKHLLENNKLRDDEFKNSQINSWIYIEKIIQLYNDMNLYGKYFNEKLNEFSNQIHCLNSTEDFRYITMGYFINLSGEQRIGLDLDIASDKTDTIDSKIPLYHLYIHETSLRSKVPIVTLLKPNEFVAQATTDAQVLNCNFLDIKNVIVCESLLDQPNFKSIIYGLKVDDSTRALDIESAIRQELINVENENCRNHHSQKDINWKDALKREDLLTVELETELLTMEYIDDLLKTYYKTFIGVSEPQVLEEIPKLNSQTISFLTEFINNSTDKLNNADQEVRDIIKKNIKEMNLEQIVECCQTLKDRRLDLSIWLDSFYKLKEELKDIEKIRRLSEEDSLYDQLEDVKENLQSLRKLYDVVEMEIDPLLTSLEELLNNNPGVENPIEAVKFELSEQEISIDEKENDFELVKGKLEEQILELCLFQEKFKNLEFEYAEINRLIFARVHYIEPFKQNVKECIDITYKMKERVQFIQISLMEIKDRLTDIMDNTGNFETNSEVSKTLQRADRALKMSYEVRLRGIEIIQDFEQLKMSLEEYSRKGLHHKVNEGFVYQLLLIGFIFVILLAILMNI